MPAPLNSLTPKTVPVFKRLGELPMTRHFILVGGSALALRIHHRKSEDLDFLSLEKRLPLPAIREIMAALEETWPVHKFEHISQREEFENTGLDLDDYQQDFMLDQSVKLSFFVPSEQQVAQSVTAAGIEGVATGHLRVATLDSLFLMKIAVLAHRVLTRDLFDLYVLLHDHGYTGLDFWKRAVAARLPMDTISYRVRHAKQRSDDPGLAGLVEEAPSFDRLKAFFIALFDEVEQELAEAAARNDPA